MFCEVSRWSAGGENGGKWGGVKLGGGEFEGASTIFGFWEERKGICCFLTKNRADGMVDP